MPTGDTTKEDDETHGAASLTVVTGISWASLIITALWFRSLMAVAGTAMIAPTLLLALKAREQLITAAGWAVVAFLAFFLTGLSVLPTIVTALP